MRGTARTTRGKLRGGASRAEASELTRCGGDGGILHPGGGRLPRRAQRPRNERQRQPRGERGPMPHTRTKKNTNWRMEDRPSYESSPSTSVCLDDDKRYASRSAAEPPPPDPALSGHVHVSRVKICGEGRAGRENLVTCPKRYLACAAGALRAVAGETIRAPPEGRRLHHHRFEPRLRLDHNLLDRGERRVLTTRMDPGGRDRDAVFVEGVKTTRFAEVRGEPVGVGIRPGWIFGSIACTARGDRASTVVKTRRNACENTPSRLPAI